MIKGWTSNGHLANHLVANRGGTINANGMSQQDAIDQLIAAGNAQANMNYVVNVVCQGSTGNFQATGQPVQFVPEP